MCSYLILISDYKWDKNLLIEANKTIISRGPDKTNFNSFVIDGLFFYCFHNLLDISGRNILQPLENKENSKI